MLTGTLPFSEALLRRAMNKPELLRETDTPVPSSRVTGLGEEVAAVAVRRHCDPDSLRHALEGDLDWITLKALAMDRTQRYETANGLAMDLKRYLAFELVIARPPSTHDRVTKSTSKCSPLNMTRGERPIRRPNGIGARRRDD